eukprot:12957414-Ditylum_brightwellii.AAC.1
MMYKRGQQDGGVIILSTFLRSRPTKQIRQEVVKAPSKMPQEDIYGSTTSPCRGVIVLPLLPYQKSQPVCSSAYLPKATYALTAYLPKATYELSAYLPKAAYAPTTVPNNITHMWYDS